MRSSRLGVGDALVPCELLFAVKGHPAEDVLNVYEKATDQEKRDLLRYDHEAFERLVKRASQVLDRSAGASELDVGCR